MAFYAITRYLPKEKAMTTPLQATSTLFVDEFTRDGTIDSSYWDYHVWRPDDGSSFYGNTQQRQELPIAQDGVLRLKLDTFNPTNGPGSVSYLGSEAITKQKFDLSSGAVAFEFVGRYAQTQPGIIAGLFTFGGKGDHHDEIDFEGMANNFSQIQTNIYKDEPSWTGRPIMHDYRRPISATFIRIGLNGCRPRCVGSLIM